ncbi:hypothetical protein [Actinomycetospora straminea]|uniref:PPE family protein n=1 Tax=Actinomycetospora straminea TaxID=663607 RepID=A0ABP9EGK9_9PSEU|nr:hypothetical protein [Actinomycetospora straminea]MDD7933717.1 hypothetical protein [Actinomycetospora straminea]
MARELRIPSNLITDAFNAMSGDPQTAIRAAQNFKSKKAWVAWQASQAGAAGGAAAAVPGLHLPALAADLAFLMYKMSFCSWGIGQIYGCKVEGKYDFAVILALWAGSLTENELPEAIGAGVAVGALAVPLAVGISQYGVAGVAGKLAGTGASVAASAGVTKLGLKSAAKSAGTVAGGLAGNATTKLVEKAATKLGPKIAAKLTSKSVAGFLPFAGPVFGAGINAYFVRSISKAASAYYLEKKALVGAVPS